MKHRKYIIFSLTALFVISATVCAAIGGGTVNAGNQTVKTVQEYLDDNAEIDYSYVDLKDGVLTVSLNSKGNGYCTMEDVQAMQYVYDAVYAAESLGEVDDVQLYIYDTTGKQIYDFYRAGVSSTIEGKEEFLNDIYASYYSAQSDDMISSVESMITECCNAEISEIEIQNSTALGNNCLEVVLSEEDVDDVKMSNLECLYEELLGYCFTTTGGIRQCSVTVQDTTGTNILYMIVNFGNGSCRTWINPVYEDVVMNIGPPSASDVNVPPDSTVESSFVETTESIYE